MLIRQDESGTFAITQPAHAWLAGQLARAWGNNSFARPEPFDHVCMGAEQHDIGWLEWERAPTLNRETGLPHTFLQLPRRVHVGIWDQAARRALVYGRYPALLTSMHGTGLYEQADLSRETPEDAEWLRELVAREKAFQDRMLESLRSDPLMAEGAAPEVVARNRRLVAVWDALSLAICSGVSSKRTFANVPAWSDAVEIALEPAVDGIVVSPWPFAGETLAVQVDARWIDGRFDDEDGMRRALDTAPWTTIRAVLRPPI